MKKWHWLIVLCVGVILFFVILIRQQAEKDPGAGFKILRSAQNDTTTQNDRRTITVNKKPLTLEIVSDGPAVTEGLGDRDSMPLDHGMLFLFAAPDRYTFWMRHMHFPLDILWIQDGTVVDMATLPPPQSWEIPATYKPKVSADHVLELNAGQANAYGLRLGSSVEW